MKRFFVLLLVGAASVWGAMAQSFTLTATATNSAGEAVAYATALLEAEGVGQSGAPIYDVADQAGRIEIEAPKGSYTLVITCIGYDDKRVAVELDKNVELGTIVMEQGQGLVIEEIGVAGGMITRQADRYVMNNIAGNPAAVGRDTYDMLRLAPGVFADESGNVSVGGRGAVKILIGERELRLSGEDLRNYLKSIPAENLQKIEIIPQSGADYDASSTGGVIRITLRRQRDDGMNGSVALGYNRSMGTSYSLGPNATLNYKSGPLSMYGNLSLADYEYSANMTEHTTYDMGGTISSTSLMQSRKRSGNGMVGAIYDLSERSSVGVEYTLAYSPATPDYVTSTLDLAHNDLIERHKSLYEQRSRSLMQMMTANYVHKLDDQGSTFKLIADWASNVTSGGNDAHDQMTIIDSYGPTPTTIDSLYNNRSEADYSYYTLTAAVEKKLSPTTVLRYGAKYTLTDTYSTTRYTYQQGGQIVALPTYDTTTDYSEHIGALYGIYATTFASGLSLSAGVRAEYTSIPVLRQNYLSLFPNLSVSWPLNPMQTVILAGNYKRSIQRPAFWQMNPVRNQLSEYSYQVGNPDLRPVYVDDLSLSAVLMYRYTVTLGALVQHDNISQLALVDEADPTGRTLKYLHKNLDNLNQYYIQLMLPAQPTPWWTINANLMGVWLRQRIAQGEPMDNSLTAQGYMTNTFTLPRGWIVDLTGQFMTDAHVGNLTQKGTGNISLAVKKRMLSDKLTLSVGVNNLLDVDKVVYAEGPGFNKRLVEDNIWVRSVNVALRYNFNAGKAFQSRNVESGAADEALRIGNSK